MDFLPRWADVLAVEMLDLSLTHAEVAHETNDHACLRNRARDRLENLETLLPCRFLAIRFSLTRPLELLQGRLWSFAS
jgi:hypothetical protein